MTAFSVARWSLLTDLLPRVPTLEANYLRNVILRGHGPHPPIHQKRTCENLKYGLQQRPHQKTVRMRTVVSALSWATVLVGFTHTSQSRTDRTAHLVRQPHKAQRRPDKQKNSYGHEYKAGKGCQPMLALYRIDGMDLPWVSPPHTCLLTTPELQPLLLYIVAPLHQCRQPQLGAATHLLGRRFTLGRIVVPVRKIVEGGEPREY